MMFFFVHVLAMGFDFATINSESLKVVIRTSTPSGHTFFNMLYIVLAQLPKAVHSL